MPYRIEFTPRTARHLRDLPRQVQERIRPRLDALAQTPRPPGVSKLAGSDDLYRLRVGDNRVVYAIRDEALLILVVRVGQRREVYRGDL